MFTPDNAAGLLGRFIKRFTPKPPNLELTSESKQILRDLVIAPNPMFEICPFAGLALEGNGPVRISCITPSLRPDTGLRMDRGGASLSLDSRQLQMLLEPFARTGRPFTLTLLGRTMPQGESLLYFQRIVLRFAAESILPDQLDVNLIGGLERVNPGFSIAYAAIASNTPDAGPIAKIWDAGELMRAKHPANLDRIPCQTVSLQ